MGAHNQRPLLPSHSRGRSDFLLRYHAGPIRSERRDAEVLHRLCAGVLRWHVPLHLAQRSPSRIAVPPARPRETLRRTSTRIGGRSPGHGARGGSPPSSPIPCPAPPRRRAPIAQNPREFTFRETLSEICGGGMPYQPCLIVATNAGIESAIRGRRKLTREQAFLPANCRPTFEGPYVGN